MSFYLEVWSGSASSLLPLTEPVLTIGREAGNDLVLSDDPTASRTHAVLQRYGSTWCLRDLGSSNGTQVNGQRIAAEQRLDDGDEILLGDSRIVFRSGGEGDHKATLGIEGPPLLTRREREMLVALCRPLAAGEPFSQPATVRAIAAEFTVSLEAVKFHLRNLYDKFRIYGSDSSKRTALANAALKSGVVTRADLLDDAMSVGATSEQASTDPSQDLALP